MARPLRILAVVAILAAMLPVEGCIISLGPFAVSPGAGGHRGNPPPHAPAHGYRHYHPADGMELVFDSELGV